MSTNKLVVTADLLNIRTDPNVQSPAIASAPRNTVVNWLGTSQDKYWQQIQMGFVTGWASHKYLRPYYFNPPTGQYPWYSIAHGELGVYEVVGANANPRIVAYLRSTNLGAPLNSSDETPWCSAFVNWCVERSGIAGTDSAWARSWLNWGKSTTQPAQGTIAVFERGSQSGHVAFFVSRTSSSIEVLGGNQSNAVTITNYPASRLLGFRTI